MKLYTIENSKHETKQVAANDMYEALSKYRTYLDKYYQDVHIRGIGVHDPTKPSVSVSEIFSEITSCIYVEDYVESNIIV